ncbi:MAG: cyclic nucleotide-binding domain-containing protein [Butyrivibrio sp.]|nr:cyclic nucleotide-binding domain-containing protein [Butyrivibrio sp.]
MLMQVPEGTIILKENEVNLDMYKIVNGCVEVYSGYGTDKEALLGILSKGKYFGEIGLLAQKPAAYTVIAYNDVLIQRITMNDIDSYIKNNHHDILQIMMHMAEAMYDMKYSLDLFMDDLDKKNDNNAKEYKAYFSKQFAKYNVISSAPISPTFNRYG